MAGSDSGLDALLSRAETDPESLTTEEFARLLDAVGEREGAAAALSAVVRASPGRAAPALDWVTTTLGDGDYRERERAARALLALAGAAPDRIADAVPDLIAALEGGPASHPRIRNGVLGAFDRAARTDPDVAVRAEPHLPRLLRDDVPSTRELAVSLAGTVAQHRPDRAGALVDPLLDVVADRYEPGAGEIDPAASADLREQVADREESASALRARLRERAAATVATVATERPAAVAGAIDPLVGTLESEAVTDETRALAVWALGLLGETATDRVATAVRPVLPAVTDLLGADDPQARGAAASLLSYVADASPEAVADATDGLLALLDDDSAHVRGSAAFALARVGGDDARDRLSALATSDPDGDVRAAAAQALDTLDGQSRE